MCLFVSVFPHDISKTNTARITKLEVDMVQHDFWKSVYVGFVSSKVEVVSHEKSCWHGSLHSCEC